MYPCIRRTRKHEKEHKRRSSSFRLQAGQRASHIYEYVDDFEDNATVEDQRFDNGVHSEQQF